MRRFTNLSLAILLALLLLQCSSPAPTDKGSTDDLDSLHYFLTNNHREPFALTSQADFDDLYRRLKAEFPGQSAAQQTMRLLQLAAVLHDGHTRVTLPVPEGFNQGQAHSSTPPPKDANRIMRPLPLRWYDYSEGLAVQRVVPGYEEYMGWRLESIAGKSATECMAQIAPYAHADNKQGIRQVVPYLLSIGDVLIATGIADGEDEVKVRLRDLSGDLHTVVLPFLPRRSTGGWKQPEAWPQSPFSLKPLQYYAYWRIDQDLYIRMDQMNNQPEGPGLIDFLEKLDNLLTSERPGRVILDLRFNSGGDNTYATAWTNLVRKHQSQDHPWIILTGRKTFSAAQALLNDLARWTPVVFLGESTGSRPSHFGDAEKMILPNSGLTLRVSQIYWRNHSGDEYREAFVPDVQVFPTLSAFRAGRDDALLAARNLDIPTDPVQWFQFMYDHGGLASATRAYVHLASDWTTPPAVIQDIENRLVNWME